MLTYLEVSYKIMSIKNLIPNSFRHECICIGNFTCITVLTL